MNEFINKLSYKELKLQSEHYYDISHEFDNHFFALQKVLEIKYSEETFLFLKMLNEQSILYYRIHYDMNNRIVSIDKQCNKLHLLGEYILITKEFLEAIEETDLETDIFDFL